MAKILIIDDDYSYAEYAQMLLEGSGHEVTICQDGESGVSTIKEEKPDLIVTDIGLPGISGFEVISRVQAEPEVKATPFVVCSSSHSRTDAVSNIKVEEKNFFSKPLDTARFLKRIAELLEAKS